MYPDLQVTQQPFSCPRWLFGVREFRGSSRVALFASMEAQVVTTSGESSRSTILINAFHGSVRHRLSVYIIPRDPVVLVGCGRGGYLSRTGGRTSSNQLRDNPFWISYDCAHRQTSAEHSPQLPQTLPIHTHTLQRDPTKKHFFFFRASALKEPIILPHRRRRDCL